MAEFESALQANSERLRGLSEKYNAWGHALEVDSALSQQIASLYSSALGRGNPALGDSYGRLLDRIVGEHLHQRVLDSWRKSLEGATLGDTGDWQRLKAALAASKETYLERLLPTLESIQTSLSRLNAPAFARETQRFITGTDALRYRGRQRVWHYTNAHALDAILKTHTLWASSPHHLNDTGELRHGVDIVREAIERRTNMGEQPPEAALRQLRAVVDEEFVVSAMHEIYYISASSSSDSLTLWRNYSTTDGFALGIRPSAGLGAEGLALQHGERDQSPDLPTVAAWYRVEYKDKAKQRLADGFVTSALTDISNAKDSESDGVVHELRKHLLILASTMKHQAFEDEREVRWITTNWAPIDIVHYHVTDRGFVPVLHVGAERKGKEEPPLPLSGLRCSPTTSPTIAHTMRGLLTQRGYEEAAGDVKRSHLPFRG